VHDYLTYPRIRGTPGLAQGDVALFLAALGVLAESLLATPAPVLP